MAAIKTLTPFLLNTFLYLIFCLSQGRIFIFKQQTSLDKLYLHLQFNRQLTYLTHGLH